MILLLLAANNCIIVIVTEKLFVDRRGVRQKSRHSLLWPEVLTTFEKYIGHGKSGYISNALLKGAVTPHLLYLIQYTHKKIKAIYHIHA